MGDTNIYLDTYVLQQDMRIRLPKTIIFNLGAVKGVTKFDIYLRPEDGSLVLKINNEGVNKNE